MNVKSIKMIFIAIGFSLVNGLVVNADMKIPKLHQKEIPEAMKIAQEFSKDHAKGLKFVKTRKMATEPLMYILESDDADFEIEPQNSEEFTFILKESALKKFTKKGKLSKDEAKAIALNFVKGRYKDFNKKNMVFRVLRSPKAPPKQTFDSKDKGAKRKAVPVLKVHSSEYTFAWIEHVKIGKYSVNIGNLVIVTVDAERHVIADYRASRRGEKLNLDSFKPITTDENAAKSIAVNFLKSKTKFRVDKVQIQGPTIRQVEPGKLNSPVKVLWDIFIEGEVLSEGMITGVFIYIDAKTGDVVYFSGLGL